MIIELRRALLPIYGRDPGTAGAVQFFTWQQWRPLEYLVRTPLSEQWKAFINGFREGVPTLPQPRPTRIIQ